MGGTIFFDDVRITGGDFNYEPSTGYITIKTTGIYVFNWKMSVTPEPLTSVTETSLEIVQGGFISGISTTATNPFVTGSNCVESLTAGDVLRVANNSNGPIGIVVIGTLRTIGTICIFRIA